MSAKIERYEDKIRGVLSCYDRVLVQGNLPSLGYEKGMTGYLYEQGIRIFDYKKKFAQPLRDKIRDNAHEVAKQAGVPIVDARSLKGMRKEKWVAQVLEERGDAPGLVCIFWAVERCTEYKPWHDRKRGKTYLRRKQGKCLHYYFYFIDEQFGLCFMRVPTWCPFRLQFYFNGHSWLAAQLDQAGIGYEKLENAFVSIDDFEAAQSLADGLSFPLLLKTLNHYARLFCPVLDELNVEYRWTLAQVEYSTDIVFWRQQYLASFYEHVVRMAVHAVKVEQVATFLGRKLHGNYQDEVGNDLGRRVRGTRIKHSMGPTSIKMYDKFGIILRIETTCNDISFFKHFRTVHHRNGERSSKVARMRKSICNLPVELRDVMRACNRRYLEFVSALETPTADTKALDKLTGSVKRSGRTYRGFNFFLPQDRSLFEVLLRGEFNLSGLRNCDLRRALPDLSPGQASHRIKRLRVHGILKKVANRYRYHLTAFGKRVLALALRLRETVILPSLGSATNG